MQDIEIFSANLRFACATRRSISQICREIGINRQQFNRYIGGEARPSPHNVARIARFFGLVAEDFSLTPKQFEARMMRPDRDRSDAGLLVRCLKIGSHRCHPSLLRNEATASTKPSMNSEQSAGGAEGTEGNSSAAAY